MKSLYFTSTGIEKQAEALIEDIQAQRPEKITISHPALLVLDMQEYFLHPDSHAFVPSAPVILPRVVALIKAFQQAGLPVIFTQHINTSQNAGMMSEWWREMITPDHPLAGLHPNLPVENEKIIQKTQYDAFLGTELDSWLQKFCADEIVITGVMTHLCCESTARAGFMRGYRVWFCADGTATYNLDFHLASLRNLAHGFAIPVLTTEIIGAVS
ncbi:MAG: cysteine hydrolase [Anaerolineales bacterium]|nr:cysteine hydrolase [Anaerolineales bacterium]